MRTVEYRSAGSQGQSNRVESRRERERERLREGFVSVSCASSNRGGRQWGASSASASAIRERNSGDPSPYQSRAPLRSSPNLDDLPRFRSASLIPPPPPRRVGYPACRNRSISEALDCDEVMDIGPHSIQLIAPLSLYHAASAATMGDHRDPAFPAAAGGCRLPKTSSVSVTESVTAVHDFKVTGYSLIEGLGIGRYVSSSTFTVGGVDWAVRFYPDGSTVTCLGNASAFLYYCGREKEVRTRFTLNLLGKDGKLSQVTNSYMKHTFSPASDNWGFIKFAEKSKLQSSPFLHNDCLTIRCLLTVVRESHTKDVEVNSVVVPPSNLHTDFENMLQDGEGSDVTFTVGGQEFRAHRCVLAFRSPVFKAELFGPMKENGTQCIKIDDMEPEVFEALLHFIYTDRLPDSCRDGKAAAMQHLLVAADRYGVDRLRLICERRLSETIDVETVATTLVLAEQHHCSQLRQACIGFVASPNMLGPVIESDGFKHLVESCPLIMKEILSKVSHIWIDKSC